MLPDLSGPSMLAVAVQTPPALTLSFYPFGVILRRRTPDGGIQEYPVDPAQIAEALAAKTRFDTGFLNPNTICVCAEGLTRTVVEYRPPQKTALHIDGSDAPFRVSLPGLVMIRTTTASEHPKYSVFAVKDRPASFQAPLFFAPLPNTYMDGAVCWGSVQQVSPEALAGSDLAEDWRMYLGSLFTAHSVSGKSRSQPQDIRKKLIELDARKARSYPKRDLIPTKATLADVLRKLAERT